jgi:hypothetical protein
MLCKIVKEHPDYYLDEIAGEMFRKSGKEVSIPTLWRSLKYCGITRKKVCDICYKFTISYILTTIF